MTIKLHTYASGLLGTLEYTADCSFEVPKKWAEKKAKEDLDYDSLGEFLDNYKYEDVLEWPKDAEREGELLEVAVHNYITDINGKRSIY